MSTNHISCEIGVACSCMCAAPMPLITRSTTLSVNNQLDTAYSTHTRTLQTNTIADTLGAHLISSRS